MADIEVRYRYNQDYKSLYAMVPATIALLLVMIPAVLTALGVVREKELGSITNLYATPVTRLEFLLGKQLPYVGIGMLNFFTLLVAGGIYIRCTAQGQFSGHHPGCVVVCHGHHGAGVAYVIVYAHPDCGHIWHPAGHHVTGNLVFRHEHTRLVSGRWRCLDGKTVSHHLFYDDQSRHLYQGAWLC